MVSFQGCFYVCRFFPFYRRFFSGCSKMYGELNRVSWWWLDGDHEALRCARKFMTPPPKQKKHILLYIYIYTRLQEFIYKFDKLCYFFGAATWRYPTLGSLLVTYCANVRHALGFATHFDFAFRSLGCTIKHVITWLNYIIIIIIMIMIVIIMIMIVSIIIIIIITFIFICI